MKFLDMDATVDDATVASSYNEEDYIIKDVGEALVLLKAVDDVQTGLEEIDATENALGKSMEALALATELWMEYSSISPGLEDSYAIEDKTNKLFQLTDELNIELPPSAGMLDSDKDDESNTNIIFKILKGIWDFVIRIVRGFISLIRRIIRGFITIVKKIFGINDVYEKAEKKKEEDLSRLAGGGGGFSIGGVSRSGGSSSSEKAEKVVEENKTKTEEAKKISESVDKATETKKPEEADVTKTGVKSIDEAIEELEKMPQEFKDDILEAANDIVRRTKKLIYEHFRATYSGTKYSIKHIQTSLAFPYIHACYLAATINTYVDVIESHKYVNGRTTLNDFISSINGRLAEIEKVLDEKRIRSFITNDEYSNIYELIDTLNKVLGYTDTREFANGRTIRGELSVLDLLFILMGFLEEEAGYIMDNKFTEVVSPINEAFRGSLTPLIKFEHTAGDSLKNLEKEIFNKIGFKLVDNKYYVGKMGDVRRYLSGSFEKIKDNEEIKIDVLSINGNILHIFVIPKEVNLTIDYEPEFMKMRISFSTLMKERKGDLKLIKKDLREYIRYIKDVNDYLQSFFATVRVGNFVITEDLFDYDSITLPGYENPRTYEDIKSIFGYLQKVSFPRIRDELGLGKVPINMVEDMLENSILANLDKLEKTVERLDKLIKRSIKYTYKLNVRKSKEEYKKNPIYVDGKPMSYNEYLEWKRSIINELTGLYVNVSVSIKQVISSVLTKFIKNIVMMAVTDLRVILDNPNLIKAYYIDLDAEKAFLDKYYKYLEEREKV